MPQTDSEILYITKLHLKGYKSVVDCAFELQKGLNIIIGKNGAGKSNLFELIDSVIEYYPKDFAFQKASFEMQTLENNSFKVAYEKSVYDLQTLKETPDSRFQITRKIYINDKEVSDDFLNGDTVEEVSFKGKSYRLGVNTGAFFVRIKHRFPFALYLRSLMSDKNYY
jgi:AAA15 family ATPase/GTPase